LKVADAERVNIWENRRREQPTS